MVQYSMAQEFEYDLVDERHYSVKKRPRKRIGGTTCLGDMWSTFRVLTFYSAAFVGVLMTLVSFHNYYPVSDPLDRLRWLDKVSMWIGIHEEIPIIVLDLGLTSSTVSTFVFHRRLADGSFQIASENKKVILQGLFPRSFLTQLTSIEDLINELKTEAVSQLSNFKVRSMQKPVNVIVKISTEVVKRIQRSDIESVLKHLLKALTKNQDNLKLKVTDNHIGILNESDERILEWLAINLLTQKLQNYHVFNTDVIFNVGPEELFVTMSLDSSSSKLKSLHSRIWKKESISAFGHMINLVTFKFDKLGLSTGMFAMLSQGNKIDFEETRNSSSQSTVLRSPCMVPVFEAQITRDDRKFVVKGKENPDYELIRERNGPFAGKKVNRPVANFDECRHLASDYITGHVNANETTEMKELIKGREIFMKGELLVKCMERGLTLPYRGGDVRMKLFIDSLTNACKMPNSEQPFACATLMYLASLVDKILGMKKSSILRSAVNIGGFTGGWPLAAAFHFYENEIV